MTVTERSVPLAGVRVVETADARGETCGRVLADLGAEVVKVEPPGGSASRAEPPVLAGVSLPFATRNAGKRSVVADLWAPDGGERLLALLDDADIWIDTGSVEVGPGAGAKPAARRAVDL